MLLRKTLYHRRLQGIFNQTFFQAKTKYPQANLSHNTSCTLPVQRSSSLTCCDFWYKSCKFNCVRPVQVSGRSELTELPSSQLWERARPRVWAPSRKASVNPPTPLIDPCSRPSPASSWWPPWQPRRCWSCSGLAPPCCPGPAGRARLSETRAKQKMRSEKKITPLTVSGKEQSDVKSSSRSLSFSSDGLEMFLQYNCCGKQYLLSGLVYAAVVFKNEKNNNNNLAHGSVSSFYLFYVLLCAKASLSNANII